MLKKRIPGKTPFVIEQPVPAMFPGAAYEDSAKCIEFLKESNHSYHMLLHFNYYVKRKFMRFIKYCEDRAPVATLWEEMAMLIALFEEVGKINYSIEGAKELINSEMLEWI